MKLENTPENKQKFMALYWGQKVLNLCGISEMEILSMFNPIRTEETQQSSFLELTPLSQITDEDAVEVAKIFNIYDENDTSEQRKLIVLARFPRHLVEHIKFINYVRTRGYYVGDGTE